MATPEILALMKEKRAKLAEQKKLSDDMHTLLAGDEKSGAIGAIESSRLTCKNLEAAIVASRRPGYFSYYAAPKEVQKMEQGKELKKITAAIAKVEADIAAIDAQVAKIERKRREDIANAKLPQMSGLGEWFSKYGRPKMEEENRASGFMSQFSNNKKVYGGTKHHQAFRSVAVTLKKGRMTR